MTMHRGKAEVLAKEVAEAELARLLGMDVRTLEGERKARLEYGEHWRVHNRTVLYTTAGVEKLRAELQAPEIDTISLPDVSAVALEPESGVALPERLPDCSLEVFGLCPNPTWVEAWTHDGRRVRCRVKNNRGMWRGMNLHGCMDHGDGRFEYRGRCPARRNER